MVGKILKRIKDFLYAIPFGMKAVDEMLTTSKIDSDNTNTIEQQVNQNNVLNDLLKGELTQEVEELRYETFKAEELSNDYVYIGNGLSVKKKGDSKLKRKKFTQYNMHQEYGILESIGMYENGKESERDDWKNRSIFKIEYKNHCVRYRLENYIEKISVNLKDRTYKTEFYIIDDKYSKKTRPLVNFIKKTNSELNRLKVENNKKKLLSYCEKNEICNDIKSLSFTTINATNDVPNGIDYNFSNAKLDSIREEDGYVVVTYSWKNFDGNILLSDKFKSDSAEKKFKNKERREGYVPNALDISPQQSKQDKRKIERENIEKWLDE